MSSRAVERDTAATKRQVSRSEPAVGPSTAGHVLALQRGAGNRAVAALIARQGMAAQSQHATLARCGPGGCSCGGTCRERDEEELLQRGSITPRRAVAARAASRPIGASEPPARQVDRVRGQRVLQRWGHDLNTCNDDDLKQRLWPGDHRAREMVETTLTVLAQDPPPPYLADLFQRYFMSKTPDVATIKRNFEKVRKQFQSNDYFYVCAHPRCKRDTNKTSLGGTLCSSAFGGSGPVVLCMNNLKTQIDPVGITAETIIHEFGHRYLNFCSDHYCDWTCGGLSAKDALTNPDSYSTFAHGLTHKKAIADLKAKKNPPAPTPPGPTPPVPPPPVPGPKSQLTSPRFMEPDGRSPDPTLEAVFEDRARLRPGSPPEAVRKVQQALIDIGPGVYNLGPTGADGIYGWYTANAVKAFKRKEGLGFEQYGDVGPGTINRLDDMYQVPNVAQVLRT